MIWAKYSESFSRFYIFLLSGCLLISFILNIVIVILNKNKETNEDNNKELTEKEVVLENK